MPDIQDSGVDQSVHQNQKPLFSFGIISDVQYSDYDKETCRYIRDGELRKKCLNESSTFQKVT